MKADCDVLVVGAGVAGVPAAVAAARDGARTVLLESRAFPGGAGVAGLHRFICGLYLSGPEADAQLLHGGLVAEVCEALQHRHGSRPRRMGRVDVLSYEPAALRKVYAGILAGSEGLETRFGEAVRSVTREGRRIARIATEQREWRPSVVIDASGDGFVIRTGADLHEIAAEPERQLAGCTVEVLGLHFGDELLTVRVPYRLREAASVGELPCALGFTVLVRGEQAGQGWLKISLPPGLQRGAMTVEQAARQVHTVLRDSLPEFRDSRLGAMSPEILEREGARLKGRYCLTADDVMAGRAFADSAARGAWPMEIWEPGRGPTYRYVPAGRWYEVPGGCLRAAEADNLLCAGRCISVTHEALGSTRVMGICMALGEAAGHEAARLARECGE